MCSLREAQFVFDVDGGTITHKCSGKLVCPSQGSDAYGTLIVISSKCPMNKVTQGFRRTICMCSLHIIIKSSRIIYFAPRIKFKKAEADIKTKLDDFNFNRTQETAPISSDSKDLLA